MKLWEFVGKQVEIVLKTGEVITGTITDWHDTGEVSDDYDGISINTYIYLKSDIETIEVTKV